MADVEMNDARVDEATGRLSDEELLAATPRGAVGNEAKVGLFVLVGLISFIVVLFWMTDPATLRNRYMLVTTVDNAGGIRLKDNVLMHGVILGRVNDFEMVEGGRVDITMEIERKWDIPVGSTTVMGASGLFGGRTLEIIPTTSTEFYEPWDTLPGEGAGERGAPRIGRRAVGPSRLRARVARGPPERGDRWVHEGQRAGSGGAARQAVPLSPRHRGVPCSGSPRR